MSDYNYTIGHADHNITKEVSDYIYETIIFETAKYVKNDINTGFFILRFELSESYPPLENALFSDVSEEECFYVKRGDRPYTDRMCHRPFSLVRHGHAIGVRKEDNSIHFYTIHGGDLAEKNPSDPSCTDAEQARAKIFWKTHALATGKTMIRLRITEQSTQSHASEKVTTIRTETKHHDWIDLPINIDGSIEEQVLELFPNMIALLWDEK